MGTALSCNRLFDTSITDQLIFQRWRLNDERTITILVLAAVLLLVVLFFNVATALTINYVPILLIF